MKLGTKSVLFGVHCWAIHPWFVAWSWWKLYGFPFDPRLWVAFFVHDLGYFGKPNMDGAEGETHVEFGAKLAHWLCDWTLYARCSYPECLDCRGDDCWKWYRFCLHHSRYYAKKEGQPFSRLCVADKLAIAITPAWLYLPLANLSGEIHEYMALAKKRASANEALNNYERMELTSDNQRRWYEGVQAYMLRWVDEHRDGKADKWTATTWKAGGDK